MNTALKAATLCALAALAACTRTVTTREVVREQPIVQHHVTPERTVIVQPPAPQSETMPPPPAASTTRLPRWWPIWSIADCGTVRCWW
jgi:hypothetical protein